MAKAVMRAQWDIGSLIWATIANANRDPKTRPQPYSPADVHPLRTRDEFAADESTEPDWGQIAAIRKHYRVTKLHGKRQAD